MKHRNENEQTKAGTVFFPFNKPFPFVETVSSRIIISALFGVFIFLFLSVFQPFSIGNITNHKFLYISGFGFITFFVMLVNYLILPILFPSFFDLEEWDVIKNTVFISWDILVIALFNWFYNLTVGRNISVQHDLFSYLLYTITIGIFPTLFLTLLIERQLWNKHGIIAENASLQLKKQREQQEKERQICIVPENEKETLKIPQTKLLCVGAEGNYSNAYYLDGDLLEKKLLRVSLKKIEEQLSGFEMIVRCHRSYIVNLHLIDKVSGNARSFKLHMENLEFSIPVSRDFSKMIIQQFK
jgi:hypothetical protein